MIKSKEEILSIPIENPELIFSKDNMINERRELLKQFHPDHGGDTSVAAHINALFSSAEKKLGDLKWETPFLIELELIDGRIFKQKYLKKHVFELGTMYVTKKKVVYVISDKYLNFARNVLSVKPKYANDKMKDHFSKYIPSKVKSYRTKDSIIIINDRNEESILLRDCPSLDQKHVTWIISRLYDVVNYFNYWGISHNGLSVDTCWIHPESHGVFISSGWWYTVEKGLPLIGMPNKIADNIPEKLLRNKVGDINIDLSSIKLIGKELLGDITGIKLLRNKDLAKPLVTWLNMPSINSDPVKEYKEWENVMRESFGPPKFQKLDLYAKDIYKEFI